MLPSSQAAGTSLEGYTSTASVAVGGTVDFFLRDPQALGTGTTAYSLTITRVGAPDVFMMNTTVSIGNQVVPADVVINGCRWTRNYRLTVPNTWPSGLYYAYIGSGGNACTVPFVVRAVSSTPGVKVIAQIQVSTIQAYNAYGGKSLYDYNSSGGVRSPKVSFDRPFTEAFNSFFDVYAQYLVRWMAKNNIAADFCTDIDIVANPSLLDPYQLFVDVGHDEYWTLGRRQTMDAFVARGGNAAYFGANTAWFQSRLEAGNGVANRTLVCYKDAAADPISDPAQKTTNFVSLVPPNPENRTTGLGYLTGCSWTGAQPRPPTPWTVMRGEHWAFAGTGLASGGSFGGQYVGYECDSARFALGTDQRPYPTGVDGAPSTLRILSMADGSNWNELSLAAGGVGEQSGYAMISIFSRGGSAGTVFNAGTVEWAYGLIPELNGQTATPLSRITLNVISKLSGPWSETADVRQFRSTLGTLTNYYYAIASAAPAGSAQTLDGLAFRAYPAPEAGTVPVYRYRSAATDVAQRRYLLRLDATGSGGVAQMEVDGIAFHAYATARADSVAIYEHYAFNDSIQSWVACYSPSATPPAGYTAGPVVFYAPTEGTTTAPPAAVGFALTPNAPTISLNPGQAGLSEMIVVNPLNGFSGSVSFSVSGMPAGVTVTLQPATSTGGTKLAIATLATTPVGSYPLTVTGTAPGVAAPVSTTLTLVIVAPAPGFTLVPQASTISVIAGQSVLSAMINVNPLNGFSDSVNFSVAGLPAGVTVTLQPSSSTSGTKLAVAASGAAVAGSYPITLTGSASGRTPYSVVLTLVVKAAAPQSFKLTPNKSSLVMLWGGKFGDSVDVSVAGSNGFSGNVTFSVSGLPSGMSGTFLPSSSTSRTTLKLVSKSWWGAQRGFFTLTIRGTSGSLSAQTTVSLTVL